LLKVNGKVMERPQHMLMRVSVGIHCGNLPAVIETYNLMSSKWFTHATPTLFNAGTRCPQLSSCFLLSMFDDSIEGIYETLKSAAMISKQAGGIGLSVHNIRAAGSYIRGTNGTSNGLIPMLRVFNNTARYVDQGQYHEQHTGLVLLWMAYELADLVLPSSIHRWRKAQGSFRDLPRAVARRHHAVPRDEEGARCRGGASARPLLRSLGQRHLHETCRGGRTVVALSDKKKRQPQLHAKRHCSV
jgi:hypothetical protein